MDKGDKTKKTNVNLGYNSLEDETSESITRPYNDKGQSKSTTQTKKTSFFEVLKNKFMKSNSEDEDDETGEIDLNDEEKRRRIIY